MAGKEFEVTFKISGQLAGSFSAAMANAAKSFQALRNLSNLQFGAGIGRLQQSLSNLNATSSAAAKFQLLRQSVKDNLAEYAKNKSRLAQLENEHRTAATATEQLKTKTSTLKVAFDTSKSTTDELRNKLRGLKAAELELKASGQALKNGQPTAEFQKLQAQILRTTTEVKQAAAAQKAASAAYKESANALKQSEAAAKSAGQAYSNAKNKVQSLKATLASQRAELQQLSASLSQAGFSASNFGASEAALKARIEQTTQALQRQVQQQQRMQQAQAQHSQASFNFNNASGNLSNTISTAQQVMSPLTGSIEKAMEFEHAMSRVKALTQGENIRSGNLKQVQEDMVKLTAQAQQLGATTQFTMTQAADAMGFLGMAGWRTTQIYNAMPGMLNLAAASGADLARTADVISDNMTAMGLTAGQMVRTGRNLDRQTEASTHFMDVYAYAMSNSNVNLENLSESMKYFAPVAKSYGATLEDAAAMTMMLGNAGIKGSMAGTSLRMGLLRLAGPPKTASKEMAALGISLSDATKGALEAQAQLEALGINLDQNATPAEKMKQVLDQLGEKTKNLSNDEKLATFKNIFGVNAETGWLALFDQGMDAFTKYRDALRDCDGYAEQMAHTMNDDARGSMIAFQSAVEAVQVSVGSAFLNTLRSAINTITPLVSGISSWVMEHQQLVTTVGISVAALSSFAVLVAGFGAVAAGYSYGVASIGVATAAMSLRWTNAISALTAFRAQIAANYAMLNGLTLASMRASFVAAMTSMRASMLGVVASANAMRLSIMASISSMSVSSVLASAGAAIRGFGAAMLTAGNAALGLTIKMLPIIAIAGAIALAGYLIYSNWGTVGPYLTNLWNTISGAVQQAWTTIQPAIAQMSGAFATLSSSIGGSQSIISLLVGGLAALGTGIAGILATAITMVASFVSMVIGALSGITTFITGVLAGDWRTAWEGLKQFTVSIFEGIINTFKSLFGGIIDTIGNVANIVGGVFNGDVGKVVKNQNAHTSWQNGQAGDQAMIRKAPAENTAAVNNEIVQNQIAQLSNNVIQIMQQNQQKEQGQQFAQLSQQLLTLMKSPEKNAESQQQITQLSQQMMQSIQQAQQDAKAQGNAEAEAAATKSAEHFAQLIQSMQAAQQQQQQQQDNSGVQQNAEAQQQAAQAAQENADAQQQVGQITQQLGDIMQNTNPPVQQLGEMSAGAQGNIQALGDAAGTAAGNVTGMGSAAQSVATALQSAATAIANIKISAPSVSAAPVAANYMGGIYGKGAFLTTFAEHSPEAAIPIDGSKRAVELWQQTGAMLGVYNASTGTLDKPPTPAEQGKGISNLYQGDLINSTQSRSESSSSNPTYLQIVEVLSKASSSVLNNNAYQYSSKAITQAAPALSRISNMIKTSERLNKVSQNISTINQSQESKETLYGANMRQIEAFNESANTSNGYHFSAMQSIWNLGDTQNTSPKGSMIQSLQELHSFSGSAGEGLLGQSLSDFKRYSNETTNYNQSSTELPAINLTIHQHFDGGIDRETAQSAGREAAQITQSEFERMMRDYQHERERVRF